ncbi:MAG: DUF885 family protein [Alphaproteobacteria bacterium]|nr:DUF885 family protein [Alphaproteobacteria bacterium]MBV9372090.1 DUF885 family protein [Alphaproteobacteria bacterium]MBV9901741.1 DUF885 family protein [Alphaproteobacteria bacterium]
MDLAPLSRRELLAAAAAAGLFPPAAAAAPASALRILLDRAAAEADAGARLAVLRAGAAGAMSPVDMAIWRMVARGTEREADLARRFPFGRADGASPYVVSQRHGAWLELDAPKPGLAERLDEETRRLVADAGRGIVPPDFMAAAVAAGLRRPCDLPAALASAAARQAAALAALRPVPGTGVGRLPRGLAWYEARLRCTAGSDVSPAWLERRVAAEMNKLLARLDRLLRAEGLARGAVGARLRAFGRRGVYPNDQAGRTAAIAGMNEALARLRPRLPALFDPPFEAAASVRAMSAADERARRRGYRDAASAAGPGAYYPDLSALGERPAWTLTTVAYHETIPGHLLQLRRQADADPHPLQLRHAAGYPEGWAVYAESLADRTGLLAPAEQIGFCQSLLFRLARVSADIGLHVRGWDRARAVRHLSDTVGFALFFPFELEVDRYCAEPAAFAGDALVALTLRRLAASRRGADLRAFHEAMLRHGPLSVGALEALTKNGDSNYLSAFPDK